MSISLTERLQNIIDAETPRKVIFKAIKQTDDLITIGSIVVEDRKTSIIPEDAELQAALISHIDEYWSNMLETYIIDARVERLWEHIKNRIRREYEKHSSKCAATRRKTDQFLSSIHINEKYLPDYLIQMFIKINSSTYENKSYADLAEFFEPLESLRRTYGKRSR